MQTLKHRDAADMVVMEVADQDDIYAIDTELLLQAVQAMQEGAAALRFGVAGPAAGRGVVTVVYRQRLARFAEEIPGVGDGVAVQPDMVGDTLQRRGVEVIELSDHAGPHRRQLTQVLLKQRQCGIGLLQNRLAQTRQQDIGLPGAQSAGQ